jgi:uncharacterized protein YhaN
MEKEIKQIIEEHFDKMNKRLDRIEARIMRLEQQFTLDNNMMLEKTQEIQTILKELKDLKE